MSEKIELTRDELLKAYEKLLIDNRDLKKQQDENQQQIYDLRRNLETATSAEAYLSQELELICSTQSSELESVQQKHSQELEEVRNKCIKLQSDNTDLEAIVEDLRTQNEGYKNKVDELETAHCQPNNYVEGVNDSHDGESALEAENLRLLQIIDEYQEKLNKLLMSIAEREGKIESLNEHLRCAEENLKSKREELEEKNQLLEITQEKVIEITNELALLKAAPENIGRKGNSLFAEVDDQRQAMKKLLLAQKKNYLDMKRMYNDSQYEMRRLKRENGAMQKELQICSNLFLNAEKLYKEKLNQRIQQLLKENELLDKRLKWAHERISELALDKGITWLDSMLSFCKNETQELKRELYSCRMQKSILEESFKNSQQDLAKWRFEALKSRCVIIHRETLLEENNIPFTIIPASSLNLTEDVCNNAKPQIVYVQGNQNKWVEETSENNIKQHQNFGILTDVKQTTSSIEKYNISNSKTEHDTKNCSEFSIKEEIKAELNETEIFCPGDFGDSINSQHNESPKKNNFKIFEDTIVNMPLVPKVSDNLSKENISDTKSSNGLGFEIHEDTIISNFPLVKSSRIQQSSDTISVLKDCKIETVASFYENSILEDYKNLSIIDTKFPANEENTMEFPLNNLVKITDNEELSPSFQPNQKKEGQTIKAVCNITKVLAEKDENNAKDNKHSSDSNCNIKKVFNPVYKGISLNPGGLVDLKSNLDLIDKLKNENIDPRDMHKIKREQQPNSILVKNYDLFSNMESQKCVTFSDNVAELPIPTKSNLKPSIKERRTKSNVIVKRIILKK